ncbi:MAG TPA: VWA domain-containing protein [Stellaceae bacterium]|nr:VWA domain-containing protein [Stellaceae bacterium]
MSAPTGIRRWRLVLGRFSDDALQNPLGGVDERMDRALDHVYGRAYAERGLRLGGEKGRGSLHPSQLALPTWLHKARRLFPESVFQTIQGHALDRFGMTELLNDPNVLRTLAPTIDLLGALIAFKGRANPAMLETIRGVARTVVDDLLKRCRTSLARAVSGTRQRSQSSQRRAATDFDWRRTIRMNLKNWDADRRVIVAERLRFVARSRRRLPWTIILCVDQSGSMLTSVIYSAVMAAVLTALPSVSVKLVVFDTAVVDLTDRIGDPVDVLMSVQLGGGTDIGQALSYCETLVRQPTRTVLVLISDLCEGGSPARMIASVRGLAEARVTMLGLAALDDDGRAVFDRGMAQKMASAGMNVAALTPDRFAEWIAGIIG